MIEYQLKDKDGNTFSLNGDLVTTPLKDSWTPQDDNFSYDNKIIDRSFLPGSSLIGEKRLMSRPLTMFMNLTFPESADFRDSMNEILFWLNKTVSIIDVKNAAEIEVTIDTIDITYDTGSNKLSSDNSFNFTALTPYWKALEVVEETATAAADIIEEIAVTNNGFLKAFPVITLTAAIATDNVQIYITADNTGIQIQDSAFGTSGNLEMVIDCEQGLVSIGDTDRNVSIVPGTGFFEIPVGSDIINVLSSETIDVKIEWKERSFI